MIDPVTMLIAPLGYAVWRLVNARAEAMVLRACADVVRAGAVLAPGTEISGSGSDGSRWKVSVPTVQVSDSGADRDR